MIEYLQSILDRRWKPVSRPALVAWIVFYVGFLVYAFGRSPASLFIHNANLVVHEGGHNLFGWFGPTLGLWGGTLLQWLVPFLLAAYFFAERQVPGCAFCLFFFFENWIDTAEYMADARTQLLPLVTTGNPEFVEHDFFRIFSNLGVLNYDTKIAAVVRIFGWCGMIACVIWLALRLRANDAQEPAPITFPKPAISLIQRYPGRPRIAPAKGSPGTDCTSSVSNSVSTQTAKPDPGK
jgi:hypothetical protein